MSREVRMFFKSMLREFVGGLRRVGARARRNFKDTAIGAFALGAGLAIWVVTARMAETAEAWDGEYYFPLGLPTMLVVAAFCGYASPRGSWLWGPCIVAGQIVCLLTAGSVGPLWAAGLCFMFGLGALCTLVSAIFGKLRRTMDSKLDAASDTHPSCQRCGYDLTGNVSGRCSECGEAV